MKRVSAGIAELDWLAPDGGILLDSQVHAPQCNEITVPIC
jgi:hypothetical protein